MQNGERARNQVAGRATDATQHQPTADFSRGPGQFDQQIEAGEHVAAAFDHGVAMRIQPGWPRSAVEEGDAEFRFELAHLVADCRRCDVKVFRGAGKSPCIVDGDQAAELSDVHKLSKI